MKGHATRGLLLTVLALGACAPKPGAGSEVDSGLTMAEILKAAQVDPASSNTECQENVCRGFTNVTPPVVASRLNLAAFSQDPSTDMQGYLSTSAGVYRVDVNPAGQGYMIRVWQPSQ